MRILYLAPELFSHGGIQRYNHLALTALTEITHADHGSIVALSLNDMYSEELSPCVHLECFNRSRLRFVRRCAEECRRSNVVILGHLNFAPLTWLRDTCTRKTRGITTLYGIEAWNYRSTFYDFALRHCDSYISISNYTWREFQKSYPVCGLKHIRIIPPAVDSVATMADRDTPTDAIVADPVLLSVSRMAAHDTKKGIDAVISCLPKVTENYPNLLYKIVGNGPDRHRLESLARYLGVEKNVAFLGSVSNQELLTLYDACSVFVLPSTKEGFGIVFLEAMQHGKPVIAANSGAAPEVIIDNETGLLVSTENPMEIAHVVLRILDDPTLRRHLGEAGCKRAQEEYSYSLFKSRWLELLEDASSI